MKWKRSKKAKEGEGEVEVGATKSCHNTSLSSDNSEHAEQIIHPDVKEENSN